MPPSASASHPSSAASNSGNLHFRMHLSDSTEEESNSLQHLHPVVMTPEPGKAISKQALSPDGKRRELLSHRNSNSLVAKRPSYVDVPGTQEITLFRHPGFTLRYFSMAVYSALPKQWPWSGRTSLTAFSLVAVIMSLHQQGKLGLLDIEDSTRVQNTCIWMQSALMETFFWIGCGILSTIGLGSGVQTGALFLFPHVCRLALAWCKEQQQPMAPSLAALLWSVAIPGFWSGGGSAAGELVPFILARLIRKAGRDPFALLNVEIPTSSKTVSREDTTSTLSTSQSSCSLSSNDSATTADAHEDSPQDSSSSASWWTPQLLLSNSRAAMEKQLSTGAFWKIFALAVVPNALFDLAGLVCGASSDVTTWEFFLATWFAKAIIRTPAQTCGLALAVVAIASPGSLSIATSAAGANLKLTEHATQVFEASGVAATVKDFFERWGRLALAKFVGDDEFLSDPDTASDDSSTHLVFDMFKISWSVMTMAFFAFFIVRTIEQIAQQYVRTDPNLNKYHENRETSEDS